MGRQPDTRTSIIPGPPLRPRERASAAGMRAGVRPQCAPRVHPRPPCGPPTASPALTAVAPTTKGLLAMARMLRSFFTLCTMFLRIRSTLRITWGSGPRERRSAGSWHVRCHAASGGTRCTGHRRAGWRHSQAPGLPGCAPCSRTPHLDGVQVPGGALAGKVHTAKGAPRDGLQDLKVVDGHAASGGSTRRRCACAARAGRCCWGGRLQKRRLPGGCRACRQQGRQG